MERVIDENHIIYNNHDLRDRSGTLKTNCTYRKKIYKTQKKWNNKTKINKSLIWIEAL